MKKKIAWITDSVSSIPEEFAKENEIFIVPLTVNFGEQSFRDNVDITPKEFYKRLKIDKSKATSSQPAIGEFVQLYEKLKEEYELGIAIHLTSKVSGTFDTSKMAADMAGFKMFHLDSKIGSKAQEFMLLEGVRLEKEGKSPDVIIDHLTKLINNVQGVLLVGELEQLYRGGRVSGIGMLIGSILKIKPILGFQDGALVPFDKVRSMKKAELRVVEMFKDSYKKHGVLGVSVIHSESLETALKLKHMIKEIDESIEVDIGEISPVLGVHLGSGTNGILWFEAN